MKKKKEMNLQSCGLTDLQTTKTLTRHFVTPFPKGRGERTAFTLAEVLITLGIIGVVAAMTIPTLIQNYQKKVTVTKLVKMRSLLNQALQLSIIDNGEPSTWVDSSLEVNEENANIYFDKYWSPYLKAVNACNSRETCGYKSNITLLDGSYSNFDLFGKTAASRYLADGTYVHSIFHQWMGEDPDTNNPIYQFKVNRQRFFVDINGPSTPNAFGKDVFLFQLDIDRNAIYAYGYNNNDEYVQDKCYGNSALLPHWTDNTCAEYIFRSNNTITYW